MATEVTRGDKLVGLFVIGAIVLTIGFAIAANADELEASRRYVMILDQSYDLRKGHAVRLRGFDIGEVESVELQADNRIRLVFRIDGETNYERVKVDAQIRIEAAIPPIKPPALIVDPGIANDVKGDLDRIAWQPPQEDFNKILTDVGQMVRQFSGLSTRVTDPGGSGMLELLGSQNASRVETILAAARDGSGSLRAMSFDAERLLGSIEAGERGLIELVAGPRSLVEAVAGEPTQVAIDEVARGERSLIQLAVGNEVWAQAQDRLPEIEARALSLLDGSQGLLDRVTRRADQLEPLIATLGASGDQITTLLATTNQTLLDVQTLTESLLETTERLPGTVDQARGTLLMTDQLLEGLQRNWLLGGFFEPDPPRTQFGPGRTGRPNPYGE